MADSLNLGIIGIVALVAIVTLIAMIAPPRETVAPTVQYADENLGGDAIRPPNATNATETVTCRILNATDSALCFGYSFSTGLMYSCVTKYAGGMNRCNVRVSGPRGDTVSWTPQPRNWSCVPWNRTTITNGVNEAVRFTCY